MSGTREHSSNSSEMLVVKLGGSVVTKKDEPETVDEDALSDAAGALAQFDGPLVVVHGGGSFGHHHAAEHGVSTTSGSREERAVLDIHCAMAELNEHVVDALGSAGLSAVPVHPLSAGSRNEDGELSLPTAQVERMLGEGFVPVLHGDVIAHECEGVTVLSGDELVVELAPAVGASRVGVCSTVPGVLDGDDAIVESIESFEAVESVLGASEETDVTGGMAGKVCALLDLGVPAHVFGPEALAAFVAGDSPGTTIHAP